jgi:hypothetical protein
MAATFAVKARQATRTPFGSPLAPDVNCRRAVRPTTVPRAAESPFRPPTGMQCRHPDDGVGHMEASVFGWPSQPFQRRLSRQIAVKLGVHHGHRLAPFLDRPSDPIDTLIGIMWVTWVAAQIASVSTTPKANVIAGQERAGRRDCVLRPGKRCRPPVPPLITRAGRNRVRWARARRCWAGSRVAGLGVAG